VTGPHLLQSSIMLYCLPNLAHSEMCDALCASPQSCYECVSRYIALQGGSPTPTPHLSLISDSAC